MYVWKCKKIINIDGISFRIYSLLHLHVNDMTDLLARYILHMPVLEHGIDAPGW